MSGEIALRQTLETAEQVKEVIDFTSWANALINGHEYQEPDPGRLQRLLMLRVLEARTLDEILAEVAIGKLQQMVPDVPGASTGPMEVNDLYVTASDFGEGMPCYIIAGAVSLDTGEGTRFTTGSSYLQTQFLAMLGLGHWPIRCQIKRINRKDRGGRFLFQMYPPD